MLKFTHRLFFIVAAGILLGCSSLNLKAQEKPPGGEARSPTPTPTPTPQPLTARGRSVSERIEQMPKVQLDEGIYGAIRWKKEYGLPSTDGGLTPNKSMNCGAFRVESSVQSGAPGTFGKASPVGYYTIQNEPTEESGYYICRYSFTNRNPLPRDRVITVFAYLGPFASAETNQALISGSWFGASEQPLPGYQRVIIGSRGVTLSDSKRRVAVDFEMVYHPIPARLR